ncbi:MAG: CPBP family intramembrane metalloprotease [Actinobacteria bacterium]|nr:CPBP family intramembrane metalloprotease [Actinomycetota bacterium]
MAPPGLGVHAPPGLTSRPRNASGPAPGYRSARRLLTEEVAIVLSLSLLASAVFAILDLLSAPIAGQTRVLFRQDVELATHLASIVFGLAPVALVLHLVRRSGDGFASIGLGSPRFPGDIGWGTLAGVAVSAVGLVLYVVSVELGVNRFVVPVPPLGHWWTVPILLLGALRAALLEEVIVVGYLMRRLEQLAWTRAAVLGTSAILRGAYHLYQGWGGFVGNVALGLAFGYAFSRWRRTWPLVIAHFLVDALAGIGYILFRGKCLFDTCLI